MKKIVISSLLGVLIIAGAPLGVLAADSMLYAQEVVAKAPLNILSPERALGAPDGAYADFLDKDAYAIYDFGAETNTAVTLHIVIRDLGAGARLSFLDESMVEVVSSSTVFPLGATQVVVDYQGEDSYRFIKVTSPEEEEWRLDAIALSGMVDQGGDEAPGDLDEDGIVTEEEADVESRIPYGDADSMAGALVKSGNSSAVYFIGEDGKRHAFPIGGIFTSWDYSFDDVITISAEQMASYMIGKNVTVRPGTWLVKLQTDPKTYAVEPGGVLRWVQTEAHARDLFGDDWNKQIFDVSDAFWRNYTLGEPLEAGEVPAGMWITDSVATFVTEVSGARRLSVAEQRALRISDKFVHERSITSEISRPLDDADLHDDIHPF
ncbi:hypothetical protein KBC55_00105 [Patescibacteria group bacterium]|nr:hypothetical protein [Patescibacteria group bacterium]